MIKTNFTKKNKINRNKKKTLEKQTKKNVTKKGLEFQDQNRSKIFFYEDKIDGNLYHPKNFLNVLQNKELLLNLANRNLNSLFLTKGFNSCDSLKNKKGNFF